MKDSFISSMNEMKNVRVVATCGVLAAMAVALKFVASVDIGSYIRIGVSNLPGTAVSALFGPATGGIFWGMLDIIKYIVAPNGPYFPGFTVTAMANGILFGAVLYKRPLTIGRVVLATAISKIVANLFFNTLWLILLYGEALMVILPARILSNVIMLPIDATLNFIVLRFVFQVWRMCTPNGTFRDIE